MVWPVVVPAYGKEGISAATNDLKVGAAAPPPTGPARTLLAVCVFNAAVSVLYEATAVLGVLDKTVRSSVRVTEDTAAVLALVSTFGVES